METLEIIDWIAQIIVILSGVMAVLLVNRVDELKKYGSLIGLIGQPAWVYTFIYHDQWLMLVVSILYTYGWASGTWNHWIKPRL